MSSPEPERPSTRALKRTSRHRAPSPIVIPDAPPVLNGITEAVVPCGKCEACRNRRSADCHRPWRGYALPVPHCTACGHNPHEGECLGCPCKRRLGGWAEPDSYWENVRPDSRKPPTPGEGDER